MRRDTHGTQAPIRRQRRGAASSAAPRLWLPLWDARGRSRWNRANLAWTSISGTHQAAAALRTARSGRSRAGAPAPRPIRADGSMSAGRADGRSLGVLDRPRRHLHRRGRAPPGRHAGRAQAALGEPGRYDDPAVAGIRHLLVRPRRRRPFPPNGSAWSASAPRSRRMPCWSARASPPSWSSRLSFADALRIAYQERPDDLRPPDRPARDGVLAGDRGGRADRPARRGHRPARHRAGRPGPAGRPRRGFRSVAVVCMHGYRYPAHETRIGEIARAAGFTQVSESHATSPLMKLVSRGDTTLVDAYLSPIIARYVDRVASELGGVRLQFMQSNGGLTEAHLFRGKDAILSGLRKRDRRHGPHRPGGWLRPRDRVRHGRHLHRRVALRGRVRAAVRDPGRRGADAGTDAEHLHGRRWRRLGAAFRRQPVPGRPGLGRGGPGPGRLPPRRPAHRHRRQHHARPDPAGVFPGRVRRQRRASRSTPGSSREKFAALARQIGEATGQASARARAGRGRVPGDRGGQHGERDQEDLGPARLRHHPVRAGDVRRGRRPARVRGRRRAGHHRGADPPAGWRAVRVRDGPGRRDRDAGADRSRRRCPLAVRPELDRVADALAADALAALAKAGAVADGAAGPDRGP